MHEASCAPREQSNFARGIVLPKGPTNLTRGVVRTEGPTKFLTRHHARRGTNQILHEAPCTPRDQSKFTRGNIHAKGQPHFARGIVRAKGPIEFRTRRSCAPTNESSPTMVGCSTLQGAHEDIDIVHHSHAVAIVLGDMAERTTGMRSNTCTQQGVQHGSITQHTHRP